MDKKKIWALLEYHPQAGLYHSPEKYIEFQGDWPYLTGLQPSVEQLESNLGIKFRILTSHDMWAIDSFTVYFFISLIEFMGIYNPFLINLAPV